MCCSGCVITELFLDGKAPFVLSQLLSYKAGEFEPWTLLNSIDDIYIRQMVRENTCVYAHIKQMVREVTRVYTPIRPLVC